MAQKEQVSELTAEITTAVATNPSQHVAPVLEVMTVEENDENHIEQAPKKSWAFKLAFIGLASTAFVFQMDATALGIALPVSTHGSQLSPSYQGEDDESVADRCVL